MQGYPDGYGHLVQIVFHLYPKEKKLWRIAARCLVACERARLSRLMASRSSNVGGRRLARGPLVLPVVLGLLLIAGCSSLQLPRSAAPARLVPRTRAIAPVMIETRKGLWRDGAPVCC